MNKLKLSRKFNILLLLIFLIGTISGGIILSAWMKNKSEAEIKARAEIIINTMNSVRDYTSKQINPLFLEKIDFDSRSDFVKEIIPSYAAKEVFKTFTQHPKYQNFVYKEATLNPTNPTNKANAFETDLIQEFKQNSQLQETTGYSIRDRQKLFYLSRPLVVKSESCLRCHGKLEDAPASMLETYGNKNGFGWKMNQVVAAQTVYVPAERIWGNNKRTLAFALAIFGGVFIVLTLVLNWLLKTAVIKPFQQLNKITKKLGIQYLNNLKSEEINSAEITEITKRQDEAGQLARTFQQLDREIIEREEKLKKAQIKIQRSEAYFRALIEQTSEIIFLLNRQQIIVYTSPVANIVFGYQNEELFGRKLADFIPEQEHFTVADFLSQAMQEDSVAVSVELRFRHHNGNWLIIEAVANNLLDNPAVNGIVVNLRDITERKQTEEKLRLLESVVVNTNDAIVITDAESLEAPDNPKIIYVNEAFCYMTGYQPEEIIGKTPRILQGEKTDRQTLVEIKQSLSKYLPIKTEIINYDKQGREYWVELNIIPIADSTGRHTHIVSVERDITQSKQAEQDLRDRETAIRTLYHLTARQDVSFSIRIETILTMGCHQFDLDVGILSKVEEDVYQVVAVKLPSNSDLDVAKGDFFDLEATCCETTIESQDTFSFHHSQPDLEHPCYLDAPIAAYLGAKVMVGGEVYGTLDFSSFEPKETAFREVQIEFIKLMAQWIGGEIERRKSRSKLAQARDEAEAANKAKSEFLATMSHEIRTPMNAVIGMTGLLLNTNLSLQQQDFVKTIRSSGDALLTLINDILDFSKIEAGKLEFESHPFILNTCIEEALNLVAPKAIDKNLELAYFIEPDTPAEIVGDITRLRQILVNLLSNAVKFTETGEVVVWVKTKKIEEQTSPEDSMIFLSSEFLNANSQYQLEFAVRDTGIGIKSDRMDRLFKSFSQVDASTSRQYGGTGLGLAISNKLASLMGGKMWVESTVGIGSTFSFTISAEATKAIQQKPTSKKLLDKKLLIVEDNATIRQILTQQTQSWGMLSRGVASSTEALDLISQGVKFDLAILDLQVPDTDGFTLARAIHQQPDYRDLPLVMLAPLGEEMELLQIPDVRLAAIINKPIKQSQLSQILTRVCAGQTVTVKTTDSTFVQTKLADTVPLRILLAEDMVVNQKVALLLLQQMGYRADIASNGIEVLEALQRQSYDVVLMDIHMPEMDGLSATKAIFQQWKAQSRPRIIAMTANAMTGDKEKCLAAGMDDYVSKPIRVEELRKALLRCEPLGSCEVEDVEVVGDIEVLGDVEGVGIDVSVLESLQEMAGEDASMFLTEMITCYLEDTEERLTTLAEGIEQTNPSVVEHTAHSLKSSSANLGAMNLAQLCEQLEQLGRSQVMENTNDLLTDVRADFQRVKQDLQAFLAQLN